MRYKVSQTVIQLLWRIFILSGCRTGWGVSTAAVWWPEEPWARLLVQSRAFQAVMCIPLVGHKPLPDGRWRQLLHSCVKLLVKLRGECFHTDTGSDSVPLCRLSSCLQPLTGSVEVSTRAVRSCLLRGSVRRDFLGQLSRHPFADFSLVLHRLLISPHCFNCICFLILPWFGDNWLLQWCYSFSRERGHIVLTFGNHADTQIFQRQYFSTWSDTEVIYYRNAFFSVEMQQPCCTWCSVYAWGNGECNQVNII